MDFHHTIQPRDRFFDLRLKEVWRYRDLMFLFVKRDFVSRYKQTLLGPAWFFIQPIFTTIAFTFVFGKVAGLPTDGVPKSLFYLAGITSWNYFQSCLTSTSNTFTANSYLFGKVYFPRVVTPLSIIISNLIQFGIQFLLFLILYFYYLGIGAKIVPNATLFLFPVLIVIMGFMGLGLGMIISAMTTKYRDLQNLVGFGMQLLMYATPVIYPLSEIPQKYRWAILANPMSGVVETFKYSFLGSGSFSWMLIAYSGIFTVVVFFLGLLIFNKTEKNFMDTV
jgi:lipopolysaccharide transport system permease protein